MDGGLATLVTRVQDLENVELTAATLPARAATVLVGTGDSSVQEPEGGHVCVEAGLASKRHVNLSDEDLVVTRPTVVSNGTRTNDTAVVVTLLVRHDDNLVVVLDKGIVKDLGGRRAALAILRGIGKRVAIDIVKDTGARAAHMVQENKTVGGARGGIIIGLAGPGTSSNLPRGGLRGRLGRAGR